MSEIHSSHENPNQPIAEAVFNRPAPHASAEHTKEVEDLRKAAVPELNPTDQLQVKAAEIPTIASMQVVIEKNISSDKTGGKIRRNTEQLHRYNQAIEGSQLAIEVLDIGYPGLKEGQKRQIQERVYPAMLRLWPELNTAFGSMTRRERQKAMEDILNDPEFQREVKTLVDAVQTNYKDGAEKTNEETKLNDKNDVLEQEQAKLAELGRVLEEIQGRKSGFDRGGTNFRLLEGSSSIPALESAIEAKKRELKRKQSEFNAANDAYGQVKKFEFPNKDTEDARSNQELAFSYKKQKNDLARAVEEVSEQQADYEVALKVRQALEDEKKKIHDEEKKAQHDVDETERKVNKLLSEKLSLQADMGISKLEKDAREEKFVKEIQNVLATAAEKVVTGRLSRAQEAKAAQHDPHADTSDAIPEDVKDKAKNRYVNPNGTLNRDRIKADYQRLMSGRGADVTKDVLGDQELTKKAEEAGKLENYKGDVTKELLTRYIQAGGKLNKSDIERIVTSDIGHQMILDAVEANHHLAAEIAAAYDKANPTPTTEEKHDDHESGGHASSGNSGGHSESHSKGHSKESLSKKIRTVVGKLPKPTKEQLFIVGALAAGGFFVGPAIIDAVLPHVHHAAARWVGEAHRHKAIAKIGHIAKETPHAIAHAASVVEDKVL